MRLPLVLDQNQHKGEAEGSGEALACAMHLLIGQAIHLHRAQLHELLFVELHLQCPFEHYLPHISPSCSASLVNRLCTLQEHQEQASLVGQ